MATARCEVPGCTGTATQTTVTGQHMCERCHDWRVADESACMALNGACAPVAFTPWWRRLLSRRL
jgi:hypothetical protein